MKFSVLIVTLNAGVELKETVQSVLAQEQADFEIIIKDGGSTDNSLKEIPKDDRISIYAQKDSGIYDGMNQAIEHATGDFCIFMNTGDMFFHKDVLHRICEFIVNESLDECVIYYGDCYTRNRNAVLKYPDKFNDYICFTMVLCHQATVYPTILLKKRNFNLHYKIAADYEYYVAAYTQGAKLVHMPITVVQYKGDGASETQKNRVRALAESKEIRRLNFTKERYRKAWFKAQIHGVGIKHWLVQQEWFYPAYKKAAYVYYKIRNKRNKK